MSISILGRRGGNAPRVYAVSDQSEKEETSAAGDGAGKGTKKQKPTKEPRVFKQWRLVGWLATIVLLGIAVLCVLNDWFTPWLVVFLVAGAILSATLLGLRSEEPLSDWVQAGQPIARGPRLLLWHVWVRLNLYKVSAIPQPRNWGLYSARTAENMDYIVKHRHLVKATIVVFTLKGGAAKTTVATWLAAFLKAAHKFLVVLFDADHGGGKVLGRFGLTNPQENSPTTCEEVIQLATSHPDEIDHDWLLTHGNSDPATGLIFFYAPSREEGHTEEGMKTVTPVLRANCHNLVFDCPPGLSVPSTRGMVASSDIHVLTGKASSGEDLEDIKKTLAHAPYHLSDYTNDAQGNITIMRAHENVVICISDVPWHSFNTRFQYQIANEYGVDPNKVVLIPHNAYMANVRDPGRKKTGGNIVRLVSLDPRALFAVSWLARVVSELAFQLNTASVSETAAESHREVQHEPEPV